jgi:hypothetical protein
MKAAYLFVSEVEGYSAGRNCLENPPSISSKEFPQY